MGRSLQVGQRSWPGNSDLGCLKSSLIPLLEGWGAASRAQATPSEDVFCRLEVPPGWDTEQ
jgi:hypothetical protein